MDDREVGRAWLYIIKNDLHDNPYGLLEDLWVEPDARGMGNGYALIQDIYTRAKNENCYKLIANSRSERSEVHEFYKKFGFKLHGHEFRANLRII
jgi:GNAT superfamily N-acetyltransferase